MESALPTSGRSLNQAPLFRRSSTPPLSWSKWRFRGVSPSLFSSGFLPPPPRVLSPTNTSLCPRGRGCNFFSNLNMVFPTSLFPLYAVRAFSDYKRERIFPGDPAAGRRLYTFGPVSWFLFKFSALPPSFSVERDNAPRAMFDRRTSSPFFYRTFRSFNSPPSKVGLHFTPLPLWR